MTPITPDTAALHDRLAALRRSVRAWFTIDGLSRLAVAVVVMVFASLAVDRYFRLDQAQRGIMLVLMVGVAGWIVYRRLLVPLTRPLDDDALCLQVEARHPELHDGLSTAVQLARLRDPRALGMSPAMIDAAVAHGAASAAGVDFDSILDAPTRRRRAVSGGAFLLLLALACVLVPSVMGKWAQRNVLLADVDWPQQTMLTIEGVRDGALVVPRGDDLTVRVSAGRGEVVPDVAYLDYRTGRRQRRRAEQMIRVGLSGFEATFRNVLDQMFVRARGGDDVTEWVPVRVIERPAAIPRHGLKLIAEPPAYTGAEAEELPAGEGSYYLLAGSRLRIEGLANKPLKAATLHLGREFERKMTIEGVPEQTFEIAGRGDKAVTRTYPAGPRRFVGQITPEQLTSGAYRVELTDTTDWTAKPPIRFTLKVRPDQTPTAQIRLEGIGDMITPQAVVPIATTLRDDYAVTGAQVVCATGAALADPDQPRAPPTRFNIDQVADQLGRKRIDPFVYRLEVAALGVGPESHVTLHVELTDNDTVGGPKTGMSSTFSLKVVDGRVLREELLRREQEQRLEFERLLRDQEKLAVDVRAMRAGLDETGRLDPQRFQQLSEIEKKQRLAGGRCESIADQFRQVLAEVINNRLEEEGGPMQTRIEDRILAPLDDLSARAVPRAADRLDAARKVGLEPAERIALIDAAINDQHRIIIAMKAILADMEKFEGFQKAINLVRELLESQRKVKKQTEKARDERIEDIFDD